LEWAYLGLGGSLGWAQDADAVSTPVISGSTRGWTSMKTQGRGHERGLGEHAMGVKQVKRKGY
jgi:hypothetical protein